MPYEQIILMISNSSDTKASIMSAVPSADKELYKKAEAYDFTKDLKICSYVDVKDTTSTWCLAQVINKTEDEIKVHYDGWSVKYDEVSFC